MTQTISIVMTGQLPYPPYESVFWTVFNEPDPTGAQSQYGANYLLNIGVDSITVDGAQVNPIDLTVGGDLTGSLPNPYVSGLQGKPISVTAPTSGQALVWSGTAWTPTTLIEATATSSATPNTLALRDSQGKFQLSSNGGASHTTYGGSIVVDATSAFSISQDTATGNFTPSDMIISTQAPYASATGSNRLPANLQINIPAAVGALASTQSGAVNLNYGGSTRFIFSYDPSGAQALLQMQPKGQILGCTNVNSATNLDLSANFDVLLSAGATGNIDLQFGSITRADVSYEAIDTRTLVTFPNNAGIGSTGDIYMQGATLSLASSGVMSVDSPDFQQTGAGNASWQADNDQTFNCGGNFTINGGGGVISLVNQGSGILLTDPAGGGITIDCNGGGSLIITGGSGTSFFTPVIDFNSSGADFALVVDGTSVANATGPAFTLQAGSSNGTGTTRGGNVLILPGVGNTFNGNVAFFNNPSSAAGTAGGSNVIWITDRTTAPSTNPTGGFIFYSESGVAKIRSAGNTVTLGNKPSVTGSRGGNAALANLLTVLATAGLITDGTSP